MKYPFPEVAPRFGLPEAARGVVDAVRSASGADTRYTVNAEAVTCTCADFLRMRHLFETFDIRRICKHLETVLGRYGAFDTCDALAQAVLRHRNPKLYLLAAPMDSRRPVVFGVTPSEPWIDVYVQADADSPFDCYGYSVSKEDWAYGAWPPHVIEIRRLLQELLDS